MKQVLTQWGFVDNVTNREYERIMNMPCNKGKRKGGRKKGGKKK